MVRKSLRGLGFVLRAQPETQRRLRHMIVDRYDPVNLFELVPTKLRLEMEPELAALDRLLEDDELFVGLKADFSKRRPNSERLGVLSRLVGRAKGVLEGTGQLFRNRTRSAKRLARRIEQMARRRGEEAKEALDGA